MMVDAPFADLDTWVAFFDGVDLPVLRHTQHEIEAAREDADRVNGRHLAGIILQDPLMTLRVLAYIEKNRRASQNADITTIERALMMIGIHPFFRDFQDLPVVEDQLHDHPKALLGLLKTITRSRHAAHWARDWAIVRHDLDVDEITVATLLYDVAEILMWCFAPRLATEVKERQLKDRTLRSVGIQQIVFGIPLYQLKLALAKQWHLPELLVTLMDNTNATLPRVRNVKLAVDLARHSANGWDDAALPDDYKAIAEFTHLSGSMLFSRIGVPDESRPAPPDDPENQAQ